MAVSPVTEALGRLEKLVRGSWVSTAPGLRTFKGLLKAPVERLLADRVPVRVGEFGVYMPRKFVHHYIGAPYEPITQQSFRDALAPGMTFVDVGAHIGFYAALAARLVGPAGAVHAFEPSPENLEYLRRNRELHAPGHMTVYPNAAGAETREREFQITESSDSHGFYAHPLARTTSTLKVKQVALDEVVRGRVDAVKIDVEGAELEVLRGMERILAENPRMSLWMEWNPSCMRSAGYDPMLLPQRMRELGFELSVLDDLRGRVAPLEETLETVRAGTPEFWYVNLFGVRR